MSETYQDIVARLPSETEIIRRLIHGLRRKRLLHTPLWRRFSDATAHVRAKGETRERRERFAQTIAVGMAQVYSNKQRSATMLCMRGAR